MYQTTTVLKTTKAVLFRMRKKNTETELTMRSSYYLFGKNFACAGTSCPISETSYVGEGHCKDRRVSVWTEWRLFHVWSFRGWERSHCSLLPPNPAYHPHCRVDTVQHFILNTPTLFFITIYCAQHSIWVMKSGACICDWEEAAQARGIKWMLRGIEWNRIIGDCK